MTDTETTTALAPARPISPPRQPSEGINSFSSEAAFETAQRMAMALCSSSLVPQDYRGKGNLPNVMIAMEVASRIGASVFAVMQNLDIIHGRPSFRATFLIATVNACGRFEPLRYRFVGERGSDGWGCYAYARDRQSGEVCEGTLITMGMAKSEGWATKSGSKWKTMPEQMLRYRSAAFWTRVYAPELSLGMHTTDEVQDMSVSQQPAAVGNLSQTGLADKLRARPHERTPTPNPVAPPPEYDPETGEVPVDPIPLDEEQA